MHFHTEELWTFVIGGYGLLFISYGVRTFPKPENKYALWILGWIQFVLLNLEQGRDNFQKIADKKVIQEAKDTLENKIAEDLKPIMEPSKKDF